MPNSKSTYSIRQVIELTGVSEYTLRGWENRYNAFIPSRSNTGRRLYSSEDILKAKALFDLTQRGHKISTLASLDLKKLNSLMADSISFHETHKNTQVEKILAAASDGNWTAIEKILQSERSKYVPTEYIHKIIIPLISRMNEKVGADLLNVTQEHIISAHIKENLSQLKTASSVKSKYRIVMACPEGDYHDMGILIASRLAKIHGISTLFLGAHFPKRDLVQTCLQYKATHLLVSSTISKKEGARENLLDYLSFIDRQLDPKTALWVAGRNSAEVKNLKPQRAYIQFNSFQEFDKQLSTFSGTDK
jgi:DNA-binding transcriptional MerR regulator/methylmalonyl-CoA mutase cobalamin-binding subunit